MPREAHKQRKVQFYFFSEAEIKESGTHLFNIEKAMSRK